MNNKLAIIIPAYKEIFFDTTLKSLSYQTNKNFKVYIGDDNSPFDLEKIVKPYRDLLDITYVKFSNNLGKTSLVKQWERCIDLSIEEWIWLFSDDDILSPTCVESFYNELEKNNESYLFKFFTETIDDKDNITPTFLDITNKEKKLIKAQDFINNRISIAKFRSYAVEYIFHRSLYNKYRFIEFPLAWTSDDATWLKYSIANNGISIIKDFVYWRYSGSNISSTQNININKLKNQANIQFLNWLDTINININKVDLLSYYFWHYYSLFSSSNKNELYSQTANLNLKFEIQDVEAAYQRFVKRKRKEDFKLKIKKFFRHRNK